MTLIPRPFDSRVPPNPPIVPTEGRTCTCVENYGDRDLMRLQDLMAGGMGQRAATRLVWPPTEPSPSALAALQPGRHTGPAITPRSKKRRWRLALPIPSSAPEVSSPWTG